MPSQFRDSDKPLISIIIPTKNNVKCIDRFWFIIWKTGTSHDI